MSGSRWNKWGAVLAGLIGTALLATCQVWAQDTTTRPNYESATNVLTDVMVAQLRDPTDGVLGATLQPVSDALRAQLGIPAGQGLLVAALRSDGPSAQAGLKQNDVLLALADKPLAAAADLTKQLRAAGEAAVPLKVLRAGKPITVQVRPIYRVTLGPVDERKTEYYIGVSIEPADDALRAQLALPAGQGVLITDVIGASPAEKAGVKKHDIVVEMAGKPIDSPERLARQVQATQNKPTSLKLLRAGKPVTIPITAELRKVEVDLFQLGTVDFLLVGRQDTNDAVLRLDRWKSAAQADTEKLQQRLDHLDKELSALRRVEALEKELKALHEAVDKINETLKIGKAPKRD